MKTDLLRPQDLFGKQIQYEIPAFQRPYVWTQRKQWEPLWDDVESLAQSVRERGRPEPHFMGAIVLQQRQTPSRERIQRRIVVDGQQRLTTLQLLIDAVQEILNNREYDTPARTLADLVENGEQYRDRNPDNAFKVWPTIRDRDAFRHTMNNDLDATDFEESRIVQAHKYFKEQTERWLDQFSGETKESDRAADALEQVLAWTLQLVVIDLNESDDPHIIFETLNARGTPLHQSEMIKNKVLHDAKIQVEDEDSVSPEQQELWPFNDKFWTENQGRGVQRRPRIDLYLNHWLTLRNRSEVKAYGELRTFEKYVDWRKNEGETVHDVAKDMIEIGRIFRQIEQVQRKDIAKFLQRRKTMNVGAVTPLLLWLLSADLPEAMLTNCLKVIESFLVRRVVCGYGAKSYGEFFVGLITRLNAHAKEADKILLSFLAKQESQGTLWPKDDELRDRFVDAPLYQWLTKGRLTMVLEGIEEQLRTGLAEEQEVSAKLHVEHIMPQAWHRHWPLPDRSGKADERRQRAIHTIGNLTLVNRRLNSSLSNAAWDSKRERLADHSMLFLNKHLVNKGPRTWDEAAIKKRAKWLHKKAVKVWPRPSPA